MDLPVTPLHPFAVLALLAALGPLPAEARPLLFDTKPSADPIVGLRLIASWERPRARDDGLPDTRNPLRVGVGLDFDLEWRDDPTSLQELATVGAEVEWIPPHIGAGIRGWVGASVTRWRMNQGYHRLGLAAGAGLGVRSDGFVGPTGQVQLLLPSSEIRGEVDRWRGQWHAPRLGAGLRLNQAPYGGAL